MNTTIYIVSQTNADTNNTIMTHFAYNLEDAAKYIKQTCERQQYVNECIVDSEEAEEVYFFDGAEKIGNAKATFAYIGKYRYDIDEAYPVIVD